MEIKALDILFRLLTAHFLADFILQPDSWVKDRQKHQLQSKYFWLHITIVGITTYVLLGDWDNWQAPSIIVITHLLIDVVKILSKKDNTTAFVLDQLAHILVIMLVWLWITDQWQWATTLLGLAFEDERIWLVLLGFLINTLPLAVLIRYLTNRWSEEISEEGTKAKGVPSLKNAGKWIGIMERLLIFTFILFNEFRAIGFLLAAKSVFRFGDLKDASDRKKTEYILIGTLISFASSILVGLVVKGLM